MDKHLIEFIIEQILTDIQLCKFYETYGFEFSGLTLRDYIIAFCEESNNKFIGTELKDLRKFILARIRNNRSRLNKKIKFEGRLFDYPDMQSLKNKSLQSIFDNELFLLIIENLDKYNKQFREITERPISLDGMYSAKEKMALFDSNNKIALGDKTAFISEVKYQRQAGVVQPLFISNNNSVETIMVSKNEKIYYKSKTLDAIDQKIMDFLTDEYKKRMYYPQDTPLLFSLNKLTEVAYNNNKGEKYMALTQARLTKMGAQGFRVYEEEAEDINDYKIVNMFEISYTTNSDNIRYCSIDLSASIKRDIKNKNTIKLYKHKLDQITNDFTSIFVNFLQNQRIFFGLSNKVEIDIPYDMIKNSVMLPYSRSKPKNILAITESLTELKDMEFIVEDFEIKNNIIKIKFYKLEYNELKQLKLEDKAKELEV